MLEMIVLGLTLVIGQIVGGFVVMKIMMSPFMTKQIVKYSQNVVETCVGLTLEDEVNDSEDEL